MDVDRHEIVTTIRSISQDMQAPITLEELMKELQCNQSGVVKECINDLSSANDIQLYQVTGEDGNTIEMIWKKCPSNQAKQTVTPNASPRSSSTERRLSITPGSTRMRVVSTPDKNLLLKQYNDLQSKLLALDKEIAELDTDYSEDDLALYIEKLHHYNEIKDVGQILLGKLAEVEGVLVKDLYHQFDLDLED